MAGHPAATLPSPDRVGPLPLRAGFLAVISFGVGAPRDWEAKDKRTVIAVKEYMMFEECES